MAALHYDFSGEHVLVTGASRGIGFAVARAFAMAGAEVTILSSGTGIHAAAKAMSEATGRMIRALECDITDSAAVKAALAGLARIDVLINNAGLERITPLLDEDEAVEATFRRITDINTNGTFYVTHHAAPKMVSGGRIILTASIWSRVAVPEFSAYITSKHANLGFMRVMAKELGPRGIRVNQPATGQGGQQQIDGGGTLKRKGQHRANQRRRERAGQSPLQLRAQHRPPGPLDARAHQPRGVQQQRHRPGKMHQHGRPAHGASPIWRAVRPAALTIWRMMTCILLLLCDHRGAQTEVCTNLA